MRVNKQRKIFLTFQSNPKKEQTQKGVQSEYPICIDSNQIESIPSPSNQLNKKLLSQEDSKISKFEYQIQRLKMAVQQREQQLNKRDDQLYIRQRAHQRQIKELKLHLKDLSTKYNNLESLLKQTMKAPYRQTSKKGIQLDSMSETIYLQQEEVRLVENKKQQIKIPSQHNPNANNEIVLLKLVQTEKQESRKQEMLQGIELSLTHQTKFIANVYDKFLQISKQNHDLRLKIQEMRFYCSTLAKVQNRTKSYSQKLKEITQKYQSQRHQSKGLLQSAERLIGLQIQLNIAKLQVEQQRSQKSKMRSLMSSLQAKINHQQEQLKKEKAKNLKLSSQIFTLQSAALKAKTQLSALKTQLQQIDEEERQDTQVKSSQLIFAPYVIIPMSAGQQIKEKIQALKSQAIVKTELIYRQDELNHNFGPYLRDDFPFLFVVSIDQNRIFGGYASHFKLENEAENHAFLFSSKSQNIQFYMKNQKVSNESRACIYLDNYLVFGNNQVSLRNNSKDFELSVNLYIFGSKYFDINSKNFGLCQVLKDNKIKYKRLQIYKVHFDMYP